MTKIIANYEWSAHYLNILNHMFEMKKTPCTDKTILRYMRYTQIKVLKTNGPWYCNKSLIVIPRRDEAEEEEKECFNDWFNLLCIEGQSGICRSDADHSLLICYVYLQNNYIWERLLRSTGLITNDSYLKIDWVIHLSYVMLNYQKLPCEKWVSYNIYLSKQILL